MPLGDRQAQAMAAPLLGAVQALERLEQLVRIAHVESDPVVADVHVQQVALAFAADLDAHAARGRAENFQALCSSCASISLSRRSSPITSRPGRDLDLRRASGLGVLQFGADPVG